MITEVDEKAALVKVYWSDVETRVAKVEPRFANIVSRLNPDKSFPLYLAYYPYGAIDADTQSSFFPDSIGGYYRLTDAKAPKDVVTHLGYSKDNTPLGMVLEKQMESFIDLKEEGITIPWMIYTPGKFFPFTRILSKQSHRVYAPNGLLSSTSGSRSTFMLPNIGCATNHSNLQRDFNIQSSPPKSLYEHWTVFKEIINSKEIKADWRCCVMYFSKNWIDKIHHDQAWHELKQYLHETAWQQFEYEINRIHYDIIFSMIQQKRNLKPNPYLTDTAKHLFTTAIGVTPGYAPALNDEALPVNILQTIFIESYGLKKYIPTIMQPVHFQFEADAMPVYYSLQHPSTLVFSPRSREASSTLLELRELEHIMKVFIQELSNPDGMCHDTILGKIAKNIQINYLHNKTDRHRIVKPSAEAIHLDKRFAHCNGKYLKTFPGFASDAPFMRGCISIQKHEC